MGKKRHTVEEIVAKLRQVDVLTAQGRLVAGSHSADRRDGGQLRNELLKGEIFYMLQEAKVIIESWRRHYNTVRPHSSLAYRTPAPEIVMPVHSLAP
jgi:transposase InsO family protein